MTDNTKFLETITIQTKPGGEKVVTLNGSKMYISTDGNVIAHSDVGIEARPGTEVEDKRTILDENNTQLYVNNALVGLRENGRVFAETPAGVRRIASEATLKAEAAARAAAAKEANPNPGQRLQDGRVYMGHSPTTGAQMFLTPQDAEKPMTFKEAKEYARSNGLRVPDSAEMKAIQRIIDKGGLKGVFNTIGSTRSTYWTSDPKKMQTLAQGLAGAAREFKGAIGALFKKETRENFKPGIKDAFNELRAIRATAVTHQFTNGKQGRELKGLRYSVRCIS
jgi:hypothetical protein